MRPLPCALASASGARGYWARTASLPNKSAVGAQVRPAVAREVTRHKRNIFVLLGALAALLGAVATNDTATAGHAPKAYVCWTAVGGFTDCDWLPRSYRIPGVRRATCADVRHDSDRSEFVLTRRRIAALAAQGVRVDTMGPGVCLN